jgi:ABC-type Fe3+ transport system substrate-binding protein
MNARHEEDFVGKTLSARSGEREGTRRECDGEGDVCRNRRLRDRCRHPPHPPAARVPPSPPASGWRGTSLRQHFHAIGLLFILAATLAAFSASAQDWQAGAGADWQRVLADAKKEGRVTLLGPAELGGPMTEAFQRDTGIEVEFLGAVANIAESRVTREVEAHNVTIDFMVTGTGLLPVVKQGFFEDENARLLLPGASDPKNWAGGTLKWVDNDKKYMLQTQASVTSTPFYDTNEAPPGGFTSWQLLLDPRYKGKIVAYDPRSGGPGQQMAGYIGGQLGIDFLKTLYVGQNVAFSQDSRQMAEWVSRGVYAIALGVVTADYVRLHDAGIANFASMDLKDGPGTISGGFSVALMPKFAPHPNAATVFLNWFASRPGQQVYSHVEGQLSRRLDVHDPATVPFMVPKPGVKYLDQYNEDWALNQRKTIIAAVLDALGGR